ncbi:unnamed protein product [Schistosoma curassoni]|uniref:Transposase n=1 Tax=Schistosoma curassoni TaxID=6186 RepID=A0A183KBL8_9TREM|nr:unnamed protein product [Schistosoma curassoni]
MKSVLREAAIDYREVSGKELDHPDRKPKLQSRNRQHQKTIEDVRTRRRTDVASGHHLVVAKIKLKKRKHWTAGETALQMFNTAFLRDTSTFNQFKIALDKRFQALQDLLKEGKTTMKNNQKGIREAPTSTRQEVLGRKRHQHKGRVSMETLFWIQEGKNKKIAINNSRTKAKKLKAKAEYTEANRKVKQSIRVHKQKYMEDLATTAEIAEAEGNIGQPYDVTKRLSGKYGKPELLVKNKEGKPITEVLEQENRWIGD